MNKAAKNKGVTLVPSQVRDVASFIIQLDRLAAASMNMLQAYKNEYGTELEEELLSTVEAEIVEDEEEAGQTDEGGGVDSPLEEQESGPVLEDTDTVQ